MTIVLDKPRKAADAKFLLMGRGIEAKPRKKTMTLYSKPIFYFLCYVLATSVGSVAHAGSWHPNHPGPDGFTDSDAAEMVAAASFSAAIYVVVHDNGKTKSAYTHVTFGIEPLPVWQLTVNCHVHPDGKGGWTSGNCYIPGWMNWETNTPSSDVGVIAGLATRGVFPGAARYPRQLNSQ